MGLIEAPSIILAAGSPPKRIAEYVGHLNTKTPSLSIARMVSPGGWEEPGQTPEFDEYTLVLRGSVRVTTSDGSTEVKAGQAFFAAAGDWVRYTTPDEEGAEYIAICLPAFSPETVHRDDGKIAS
jgi:mannose-6-phosphate isomerase-like protein (cupin superfamily)